jgi:hypothetical protein
MFADISHITPHMMIERSKYIQQAYQAILSSIHTIPDRTLKETIFNLLEHPVPTFLTTRMQENQIEQLAQNLFGQGWIADKDQFIEIVARATKHTSDDKLFLRAPGAQAGSHNTYPGGLVIHTLFNVESALALAESYETVYHTHINNHHLIGVMALHDVMKSWILHWTDTQEILPDIQMAHTPSHHIFMLAESLHRKIAPVLIQMLACIHLDPTTHFDEVVNYITAASLLAGIDAFEAHVLEETTTGKIGFVGGFTIEHWIAYAAEHSTRNFALEQARVVGDALKNYAKNTLGLKNRDLKSRSFFALRNYILSQETEFTLYEILKKNGVNSFNKRIDGIISEL